MEADILRDDLVLPFAGRFATYWLIASRTTSAMERCSSKAISRRA